MPTIWAPNSLNKGPFVGRFSSKKVGYPEIGENGWFSAKIHHKSGYDQWRKLWGAGGQLPPPQFNKIWKFSIEVRNFKGGIETAMKKRVADEKQRVSILNEQTKCSHFVYSISLSFLFLSKTRRKL